MSAAAHTARLGNGLELVRAPIEGTRAATLLVAFAAGSRHERPGEEGVAHFLEHLVFQGGERHRDARAVNWASERLGARMNAFTGAELTAFHITVRAERLPEAAALLSDFLARPRLEQAALERERGVVAQEIARSHDQPASLADELIDRAAWGEHPLGRSVLGTEESVRSLRREDVLAFRERRWSAPGACAVLTGNLAAAAGIECLLESLPTVEASAAPPPAPPPAPAPRVLVERRDSRQSHLRIGYRPAVDMSQPAWRAALTVYSTLLGGSMGSRLADEIRERRGLAYSVGAADYPASDGALVQLTAGLESARCAEAAARMREIVAELGAEGPPREEEMDRVRAVAAGRRVLGFESTGAVARHAAGQRLLFDGDPDPGTEIARLDAVTREQAAEVAALVAEAPAALACVGPHEAGELGG